MSKRFIPQQNGERKKPKLDVTISDHNFPLSQNPSDKKDLDQDGWGDENDDEILLLASQACEQAYNNDISILPNYSMCMEPISTSTQICDPGPSSMKSPFTFKKPTALSKNLITTELKDKCNRISSPLPGISSQIMQNGPDNINLTDDFIFNDKIYKNQDSEYVYRQLLQLQEENAKLKSENGKLLEKCVTKEGEASILRTQLKTFQVSVDNARLEKIKAQEKVQMEWTEKLAVASNQMHDLRTQLDFKNLEIISIKEKCRMLESNKVKRTQVTVPVHDISSSQSKGRNDSVQTAVRRNTISTGAQTETKAHLLKLNKAYRTESSSITTILPLVLEATQEQPILLESNEKLSQFQVASKRRVLSSWSVPAVGGPPPLPDMYGDLTRVAVRRDVDTCFNIMTSVKTILLEVQRQLELVSNKVTTAFQKEMDEKYMDHTSSFLVVAEEDLLTGRILFKEEQAIHARRTMAVLVHVLKCYGAEMLETFEDVQQSKKTGSKQKLVEILKRICYLLDSSSCALLYSGLLLSITYLLENLNKIAVYAPVTMEIVKSIILSRPMLFVSCSMLKLMRKMSEVQDLMEHFCIGNIAGNLKLDYDQGVLLYKKESCYLQVLLKQVETALKCIERQELVVEAVDTTQNLIAIYTNINEGRANDTQEKQRCDCNIVLIQIIVYALRICAAMLGNDKTSTNTILPICRTGTQLLYQCNLRDVEFSTQLGYNEGHLIEFCEVMRRWDHSDTYRNMLSELSGTFQSSPEESTSFHKQAWLHSFDAFSIID